MLTQIIQWIIYKFRQNICWHQYQIVNGRDIVPDYYMCDKCGYIKF